MSDTDVALRLFFWQQLRPALIRWGALAVLALCVWGAVQAWVGQLAEAQAQAQAERSAASEQLRQLEEDAALIAQNAERYQRWTTLGIIGGRPVAERRALWLQRWQEALAGWFPGWEKHVTLTLEPPEGAASAIAGASASVADPAASPAAGASFTVTHHPLVWTVQGLTDIESLQIVQRLQRELAEAATLQSCDWQRKASSDGTVGVEVTCRARLTYIYRGPSQIGATDPPTGR